MTFAACLLGTHVSGCTYKLRSNAQIFFPQCEAEVDDVRFVVAPDQNVAWLHIPVHESLAVCVI